MTTGSMTGVRRAEFHHLTVDQVSPLTEDAVAISFAVPPELAAAYDFQAGQHLTIRHQVAGAEVRRNYSICAPAGSGRLRVAVKRLPGGAFSGFATGELRAGDRLEVMTPTGRFTLRPDPAVARRVVAIAAGSGITPVISILTTLLEHEPASRATLVYGNRDSASVMFLEELADLKDRYTDRFLLLHVLSRERGEVELRHGRLDAAKLGRLLDTLIPVAEVDEWYLCGPHQLVDGCRACLLDHGVTARQVHTELFHVAGEPVRARPPGRGAPAPERASEVTVVLDGRTSTFPLDREGGTILSAALAARPDAPYACTSGVCGTCRARLRHGSVRMDRNHALDPDEVADGYVLACQSHPTSDAVTLDFDG
jgi:ring-1,2-phenylacetyl-CoA epoxidase subunit PaaE